MMSNKTLSMLSDFIARYYLSQGQSHSIGFPDELGEILGVDAYDPKLIFKRLAELNILSLSNRYPEDYKELFDDVKYIPGCDIWEDSVIDLEYGVAFMKPWHYQILKSFDCYMYQSCEGNCYKLPLYRAIEALRDKWGGYIAENQPGYSEAKWN